LIRFLVKDDEKQAQIAYQVFTQAEIKQDVLFVPLLVVLETIWVLQSVYEDTWPRYSHCFQRTNANACFKV
jgi:predicted nucleic-acid-binding protein